MGASYALALFLIAAPADPPAPQPGVLLLDDFTLAEGTVEPFGKLVRVVTADRTRVLPTTQVLFTGKTRADAYKFMTDAIDPDSAADRVKLAQWFVKVNDPARAAIELRAAQALAPNDTAATKLLAELSTVPAAKAAPATKPTATPPAPVKLATPPNLPAEVSAAYGSRVQPILMNLCASCHAGKTHTGGFPLERIPEGYANTPATGANLAAVMAAVDATDSPNSPLLKFALTPHGGQKSAALTASHPAYYTLSVWVAAAAPPPRVRGFEKPVEKVIEKPAAKPVVKPVEVPKVEVKPAVPAVKPVPNPVDPYDPAAFNRRPAPAAAPRPTGG